MHAGRHSFIQSSIHLWAHSLIFLGETSIVGNNTRVYPSTCTNCLTLILAGDLRSQMLCRTWVCLKIGNLNPLDYHHYHHDIPLPSKLTFWERSLIHPQLLYWLNPFMLSLCFSQGLLVKILIVIVLHKFPMFNIILKISPIPVLLIIPFTVSLSPFNITHQLTSIASI